MSTEPVVGQREVAEMVGDLEIPCDYAPLLHCGPAAARWSMFLRCGCGMNQERLACGGCKNILVSIEEGLECPVCDEVFMPARKIFRLVKWLR